MQISPIISAKAELTHGLTSSVPIVLSTRIRLARNLARHPFPGWAKESQRREILTLCERALTSLDVFQRGTFLEMETLSGLDRQVLVERHLVSLELTREKQGAGVVFSRDQSYAVMVNEEDHLRIQVLRGGFRLKPLWKSANDLDSAIEHKLDFAFSPTLGYLTACPTNLGTALRASAMLHLPALVMAGHMDKVVRMVNQVGMAVRGLFGEGSDAKGSIFQISNQQTLGESEEEILKRLQNVLQAIIRQETNARQKLLEDDRMKFFDRIGRALGIIRHAYMLSSEESMNLLSLMRLAVDVGMFPPAVRTLVDRLFIEAQPAHVQAACRGEMKAEARDRARAQLIRERFEGIPPLDFNLNLGSAEEA